MQLLQDLLKMNWSVFTCFVYLTRTIVFCQNMDCSNISNGRICKFKDESSYRMATADNGELLIFGRDNFLYSFDTENFMWKEYTSVAPNQDVLNECNKDLQPSCENSISVIQQIPQKVFDANSTLQSRFGNHTVLVCGTNAFSPRCTVHNPSNLSDWFYLNPTGDAGKGDLGFSPYSDNWDNIGMMTSGGKFYSATNFDRNTRLTRLVVSLNPLSGDTSFAAASADRDQFWVSTTTFISLHELPDHIYFFGREPSYELKDVPEEVFGRVMRVCKTDKGITETGYVEIPRFKTFQKVRIACKDSKSDRNSFPYYYNKLQATYLYWPSEGSLNPTLYTIFTSPINGPTGSAICKFSFDSNPNNPNSLSNIFEQQTSKYYKSDNTGSKEDFQSFRCPGESGRERTTDESLNYLLIEGVALPKDDDGNAMHTAQGDFFTHICVDVYDFSGSNYEVMFVGTKNQTIDAIEYKDGKLLSTRTVFEHDADIGSLILDKSEFRNGDRKLFIAGKSFIASVSLGTCEKHQMCKECLESNDPYCAWQSDLQVCINKLVSNSTTDILEATEVNINMCPSMPSESNSVSTSTAPQVTQSTRADIQPATTAPRTAVSSTTGHQCAIRGTSISTTVQYSTSTIFVIGPSGEGVETSSQSFSAKDIGEYIGVGLGGLVVGIILGIATWYFGTVLREKASNNYKPDHDDEEEPGPSNMPMQNHYENIPPRTPRVEQYTVTINIPEDEKANLSPPPSNCVSPPAVDDSELEDDVISDLPNSGPPSRSNSGRIKKWSIPKGRTPSTRWLRASESSTTESESPVSPF